MEQSCMQGKRIKIRIAKPPPYEYHAMQWSQMASARTEIGTYAHLSSALGEVCTNFSRSLYRLQLKFADLQIHTFIYL